MSTDPLRPVPAQEAGPPGSPTDAQKQEVALPGADLVRPPKISVIVTCYNYERYLGACLRSIAAQTYRNFDCVVVDDLSTDGSAAVARAFETDPAAAGRFRTVVHAQNGGQMAGFKTGLAETDGHFVVFVDADDVLFPAFLEAHLAAHLNASFAVAFTCSDQLQISDAGEVIAGTYPQLCRRRYVREDGASLVAPGFGWSFGAGDARLSEARSEPIYLPALSRYVLDWFWSTTSAMMYRRAALEMILSRDCDQFRISADFYLVKYCQLVGGSLVLPRALGAYRRHGANGFGSSPAVGGEQGPGNTLKHVAYGKFRASFTQHVLDNFAHFVGVLGARHAHLILAHTAPRQRFWALALSGRSRGGPHFSPVRFVASRARVGALFTYVAFARRVGAAWNLLSRRPIQPDP